MALRTSNSSFIALCLLPPGNLARDYALWARRHFAATGDWSALAFPTMAILDARPGKLSARQAEALAAALRPQLDRVHGKFSPGAPQGEAGCRFQPLGPAHDELCRLASPLLAAAMEGTSPGRLPALPLPLGRGIYLGKTGLADKGEDRPPEAAFFAATLAVIRFRLASTGLEALSWRQLAALRRLRGRPPRRTSPSSL